MITASFQKFLNNAFCHISFSLLFYIMPYSELVCFLESKISQRDCFLLTAQVAILVIRLPWRTQNKFTINNLREFPLGLKHNEEIYILLIIKIF